MTTKTWFDLPQERRFETLISALNHEPRNLILSHILGTTPKTGTQMMRNFNYLVGIDNLNLVPGPSAIHQYCSKVLEPLGMVVKMDTYPELGRYRFAEGWIVNAPGKNVGKPTAAYSIQIADRFKTSLVDVLGATRSNVEGGPYTTAQLLMELNSRGTLTAADLAKSINYPSNIGRILHNLDRQHIVEYNSVDTSETYRKYKWIGGDIRTVKFLDRKFNLTEEVAKILYNSPVPIDASSIRDNVRSSGENFSHQRILTTLNDLKREKNLIESINEFESISAMSEVTLTQRGEDFVKDFIYPIQQTSYEAEPPTLISRAFDEQKRDLELLKSLASRAVRQYFNSPKARRNNMTYEDRSSEIALLLTTGPMKSTDISDKLGIRPHHILRQMIDRGEIEREIDGNLVRYKLKN